MRALGLLGPLDHGGGTDIAKDEMAIPVAPFQMAGTDLGIDHQRATHRSRSDHIRRGLNTERGRGTGDIHVKGKAPRPQ